MTGTPDRARGSATGPRDARAPAHPGLHIIAVVEVAKGVLALLAASGLELLGPAPIQQWLRAVMVRLHVDPAHGKLPALLDAISPAGVHMAAAVAVLYGLVRLAEGWGLWHARAWASWLGCVTVALYLPLDAYALIRHPGRLSLAVVSLNLLVLWVLARDLVVRRRRH